ncbi:hypothetical protein AAKU52_003230 [Pedobacter sp. CG_S7]|uniref:hypothetical protein n=1 Tax=Pedobacter sp. CG_S7 TaxID=3143930 RepID=UPI0033994FB6
MGTQPKKKFINEIWVTGLYRDREVLGRTYRHSRQNWIILITDDGKSLIVPYEAVSNIMKISIIIEKLPKITSTIQNKKRFTAIDKLILATLSSLNN